MSPIKLLLLAGLVVAMSCSNPATETPPEPAEDSASSGESAVPVQAFPGFIRFLQQQDSAFDPSRMTGGEIEQAQTMAALPLDSAAIRPFKPYLLYNTDSSLAIDLVIYNYFPHERGTRLVFEEAGPDYEAAVIDFRSGQRRRLLFFGTSGRIMDARWLDDHTIAMAGSMSQKGDSLFQPAVWIFDVKSGVKKMYTYPDLITGQIEGYKGSLPQLPGQ
jgi:hypothetical protein